MYIMLLKVYYSSFSAFTACTFDWLIDGRSLVKTKLNHLIKSVCFRVQSITKAAYILVGNTEITVWKCTVKSTVRVHGTWIIGHKIAVCWCQNRLTYVMVLAQIHTLLHFEHFILSKTTYIFCLLVLEALISVIKSTWLPFKICWRRVTRNVIMDNFDLVLLNKLTYSGPCTHMLKRLRCKHFLKPIYRLSNCY